MLQLKNRLYTAALLTRHPNPHSTTPTPLCPTLGIAAKKLAAVRGAEVGFARAVSDGAVAAAKVREEIERETPTESRFDTDIFYFRICG